MRTHAVRMFVLSLATTLAWASSLPASTAEPKIDQDVIKKLSAARLATAKYATDLARAKADGYTIITPDDPQYGVPLPEPEDRGI